MKSVPLPRLIDQLRAVGREVGGVFSFGDLCNLIGAGSEIKSAKVITRLVRLGHLRRVVRGLYVGDEPDLWTLGARLKKDAYVSMDSVMAKNGLVGTIPERSVSLVYPGRKTTIEIPGGLSIRFYSIQTDLLFGFFTSENGIQVADSEKAYLDLIYFYTKGASYVFDALKEVNLAKLDRKKLMTYLKRYKNPKFVKFVKGLVNEVA
ncbi:MAG: hypothetical protein K8R69_00125 [Deltaproteobacteria bacterium]|nr:hypothetical protein [Deltaproteobacteria bacterium]